MVSEPWRLDIMKGLENSNNEEIFKTRRLDTTKMFQCIRLDKVQLLGK